MLGWVLTQLGAPAAVQDSVRRQQRRLLDAMLANLSPSDRALAALNKWSAINQEIAAR